jgi:hypothetical protein
MWIASGRAVVFRTNARGYKATGPRVGMVVSETGDDVTVRVACGRRRYCATPLTVSRDLVAREATEREVNLGYPVEPVPPRVAKAQ